VGFSTEQGQLGRVFARLPLIGAQGKAVSIAEIACAIPILAPDNSLTPCLSMSAPAVHLSSDELDRFIESLQCAPVARSKTIFGSDDDEDVSNERPMDKGRGRQSDRARDGKLSQGAGANNAGSSCSKPRSGKAGFFWLPGSRGVKLWDTGVNNREETSYEYDNGNGESFKRCI
jgi:hypothetical protein